MIFSALCLRRGLRRLDNLKDRPRLEVGGNQSGQEEQAMRTGMLTAVVLAVAALGVEGQPKDGDLVVTVVFAEKGRLTWEILSREILAMGFSRSLVYGARPVGHNVILLYAILFSEVTAQLVHAEQVSDLSLLTKIRHANADSI